MISSIVHPLHGVLFHCASSPWGSLPACILAMRIPPNTSSVKIPSSVHPLYGILTECIFSVGTSFSVHPLHENFLQSASFSCDPFQCILPVGICSDCTLFSFKHYFWITYIKYMPLDVLHSPLTGEPLQRASFP